MTWGDFFATVLAGGAAATAAFATYRANQEVDALRVRLPSLIHSHCRSAPQKICKR